VLDMMLQGAGTRIGQWTTRSRRAVRRLSERTPLRVKLITAMLALVTIALGVIGVASVYVLHSYLTAQSDNELKGAISTLNTDSLISNPPGYLYPIKNQQNLFTGIQLPGRQLAWSYAGMPDIGNPGQAQQSLPALPTSAGWAGRISPTLVTVPAQSGSDTWRVIAENYRYQAVSSTGSTEQVTGTLVVGTDLGNINATVRRIAYFDMIVGVVIVFVLALVGVAAVRANLRPLDEIEETAEAIADGHLDRRVPERDPRTEIGRLGRSLNSMLSQIEAAFHAREESEAAAHKSEVRMRRFIADAGHELRTPLTAIRGFAEYYRQRGGLVPHWDREEQAETAAPAGGAVPPGTGRFAKGGLTPDDLDRIMQRLEKEAARMGLLVEDLLLLARLDQQRPLARQPIDLLSLAADAVHDARLLAPSRTIDLSVQPGAAFLVIGDEPRLRQVIGNLMSNALTHTPDGTPIEVSVGSGTVDPRVPDSPPAVTLDVTDHGPGMTSDQAHRVFERFYRADQARTRATGGSGLGLAIVNSLVAAHGGVASVRTAPGRGATFRIALPLAPEAQGGTAADDDPDTDESGEEAGGTRLEAGNPAEADRAPAEADRAPAEADRAPAEADRAPAGAEPGEGGAPAEADRTPADRASAGIDGAVGEAGEADENGEDVVTFGTKVRGGPPPSS
jgi:two-component system OmpR family sensor kinase